MRLIGVGFVRSKITRWRGERAKRRVLAVAPEVEPEIARAEWEASLRDPTGFYLRAFRYFHRRLPAPLQEHRRYFSTGGRGFGEDAFHTMWFLLRREFGWESFLEIGVFRGQTLSLCALLSRLNQQPCEAVGISPFSSAGDSVSRYQRRVDYREDTLANFDHFGLPHPQLLKAYSTDAVALERIASRNWGGIYIDGNHEYQAVKTDWNACSAAVAKDGVIVLDDSALGTAYRPPSFAFGGHPGPSRVAAEIDRTGFHEILRVGHNRVFQRVA
jgi:hypothetical protein